MFSLITVSCVCRDDVTDVCVFFYLTISCTVTTCLVVVSLFSISIF